MAEAWARMNRKPAVAMVTAGPGFTNALIRYRQRQIVQCPGDPHCRLRGAGERREARSSGYDPASRDCSPWSRRPWSARLPERIPEYIDMAFRAAMSGRPGPVYLELPCDLLNATIDPAKVKKMHTTINSKPVDRENTAKSCRSPEGGEKSRRHCRQRHLVCRRRRGIYRVC